MKTEKRLTVSFPPEVLRALEEAAEAEGCSASWLIRRFVKRGLEAYSEEGKL